MQSLPEQNRSNNQGIGRKRPSTLNLVILAALMGFLLLLLNWLSQDISGQYTVIDPNFGVVTMSFVRRPSNIHSRLGVGTGAYLESDFQLSPSNLTQIIYMLPEKWLREGRPKRRIIFIGTIRDGVVNGELRDEKRSYPVLLKRDMLASIIHIVQAYLPWGND